jgi:hypothetical protein
MSNQLGAVSNQKSEWRQFFGKLTEKNLVSGDCQCCMKGKKNASNQCKWTWRDKCSALDLAE